MKAAAVIFLTLVIYSIVIMMALAYFPGTRIAYTWMPGSRADSETTTCIGLQIPNVSEQTAQAFLVALQHFIATTNDSICNSKDDVLALIGLIPDHPSVEASMSHGTQGSCDEMVERAKLQFAEHFDSYSIKLSDARKKEQRDAYSGMLNAMKAMVCTHNAPDASRVKQALTAIVHAMCP